ncbi:MAG: hypothetical protein SFV32_02470 [Opitutaceae bacterium]|nr:hypothetical protein [Opitutaceae bacterium]
MRRSISLVLHLLIALVLRCGASEVPAATRVTLSVKADEVVHRMDMGIGINVHAIETPPIVDEKRTYAGSVWRGNPDPDDDAGFFQLLS